MPRHRRRVPGPRYSPHVERLLARLWNTHVGRMLADGAGRATRPYDEEIGQLVTKMERQGVPPLEARMLDAEIVARVAQLGTHLLRKNPYYHATRSDSAAQIVDSGKFRAAESWKYDGRPAVFAVIADSDDDELVQKAMDWADNKHSFAWGPGVENALIRFDAREPDEVRGGIEAVWFGDLDVRSPKIVSQRPGKLVWNTRNRRTSRKRARRTSRRR